MRGYTLLELLIVLLLLSLVTGLVMPRLSSLYESATRAYQQEDLLQQISALGYQAYRQGKTFQLIQLGGQQVTPKIPLTLPDDWTISTDTPIFYHSNGVCTGGIITIHQKTLAQRWKLRPPLCQPEYDETD